ncbi:MAG TPA: universal stress protein [Candidatus Limnocylindrales bacterium]|jgi:nucleotide-binding universal stress UspA family protein
MGTVINGSAIAAATGKRPSAIRTVLLATDLTAASNEATDQAIEIAVSLDAQLLIVHVIDGDEGAGSRMRSETVLRMDQRRTKREAPLLSIVERARSRGGTAAYLLWSGEPGPSIVAAAQAEGADLIVVGTRGLDEAGKSVLGSVSNYVVYHSDCPVLVAH